MSGSRHKKNSPHDRDENEKYVSGSLQTHISLQDLDKSRISWQCLNKNANFFPTIGIKTRIYSQDRGKMGALSNDCRKKRISLKDREVTLISSLNRRRNANFVNWSQKKFEHRETIWEDMRISSKDRKRNAIFVTDRSNPNFVKASRRFFRDSKLCKKKCAFRQKFAIKIQILSMNRGKYESFN